MPFTSTTRTAPAATAATRAARPRAALRHALALTVASALLGAAGGASAQSSTVQTSGVFTGYSGPAGAPIYAGDPPVRDGSDYQSHFAGNGWEIVAPPTTPYAGYEGAAYAGTGTTSLAFPSPTSTLAFWSQVTPTYSENVNFLSIAGAVTSDVAINPATQTSGLFKLATLTFTNGNWFLSRPYYNPGLGQLYGESSFAFSVTVTPTPFIGHPVDSTTSYTWSDSLILASTGGTNTPDVFYFRDSAQLGSVLVNEGTTGSVEVWGRIGSLQVVELRNPTEGVTLVPFAATIPEPQTWAMLLGGVALVALRLRRRLPAEDGAARAA